MTASISQIRTGIATNLARTTGLRVAYDVEPDQVVCPCAIVSKVTGEYQQTMSSLTMYQVEVVLLLSAAAGGARGQRDLDAFLAPQGASSLVVSIESDPSLGGVADLTSVQRFREAGLVERMGTKFFGAFVDVLVLAS